MGWGPVLATTINVHIYRFITQPTTLIFFVNPQFNFVCDSISENYHRRYGKLPFHFKTLIFSFSLCLLRICVCVCISLAIRKCMNWNQECLVTKKTKEKAGKEELLFYALNVSKLVTTMVFSENQCLLMFSSLRVCVCVSLLTLWNSD
jgi:hypothetical protein